MIVHVVAMAENRCIGQAGRLPWHLPDDLKRFKQLTMGAPIIMGRKTYDSIGRALPGRYTIVVSRSPLEVLGEGCRVASLDEAWEKCEQLTDKWGKNWFVVGGGEIYTQTMPMVEKIYLTLIHKNVEGDAYYPKFDTAKFDLVSEAHFDLPFAYSFLTYQKNS